MQQPLGKDLGTSEDLGKCKEYRDRGAFHSSDADYWREIPPPPLFSSYGWTNINDKVDMIQINKRNRNKF